MAKRTRAEQAYDDLHAAEKALCYAAAAWADGQGDGNIIRVRVAKWRACLTIVSKLAFTKTAVEEFRASQGSPSNGGEGGGTSLTHPEAGKKPRAKREKKVEEPSGLEGPTMKEQVHATWLTPYGKAWKQRYQGTPAWGMLARFLKPLEAEHGPEEVLRRWTIYLTETPGRFASPAKFAATWGEWEHAPRPKDPTAVLPGETADQYLARMTNG